MARARSGAHGGQGKKLKAIARALHERAHPATASDSGIGIPERARASFDAAEPASIEVWEENAESALFFADLQRPWRIAPTGSVIGLDYGMVLQAMKIARIKRKHRQALLNDLLTLSEGAMEVLNAPQES